jgi:hypothetical protein
VLRITANSSNSARAGDDIPPGRRYGEAISAGGDDMVQDSGASWRITIDEPEDLHLALFVRDAAGLDVRGVPGVPGPLKAAARATHPVLSEDLPGVTLDWGMWWRAILAARRATSGAPPEHLSASQQLSWARSPREAVGSPPAFDGLAHAPDLRRLVTVVYRDRFAAWWQGAMPTDSVEEPVPERRPRHARVETPLEADLLNESLWRGSGPRGELVSAHRSAATIPREVVAEVELEKRRRVSGFSLSVNVMAVHDVTPTIVAADYMLVPVALYREPALYRAWLRTVVRAIA